MPAIVFDLDDTLCHASVPFETLFETYFGVPLSRVDGGWNRGALIDGPCTGEEAVACAFPHLTLRQAKAAAKGFSKAWAQVQEPFPGVYEFLAGLRASFPGKLAILTNGPEWPQRAVIERLGFSRLVDAVGITGSAGIGRRKPAVECFRRIECLLSVPAADSVMVGDSLRNDIAGALDAGWRALWVRPGRPEAEFLFLDAAATRSLPENPTTLCWTKCNWG